VNPVYAQRQHQAAVRDVFVEWNLGGSPVIASARPWTTADEALYRAEIDKEIADLEHDIAITSSAGWGDRAHVRREWISTLRHRGWTAYWSARQMDTERGRHALLHAFIEIGLHLGFHGGH
jgi:hypothetical protein